MESEDFKRELADDLLLKLYSEKFARSAPRRPFCAVLGDADVVGGLYRNPHKIIIPIEEFEDHELTFMCPDHFHLVGLSGIEVKNHFGLQAPQNFRRPKILAKRSISHTCRQYDTLVPSPAY